jgi:hypothetical protein
MGGSGGGGGFSSADMARLQAAAEERLKAVASKSTKILFICESADRATLDDLFSKSTVLDQRRIAIVDSSESAKFDAELDRANFLVVFTDQAKATPFIDKALDKALMKKIATVHVQGNAKAIIPSKVTAYRWRSMTWNQLESIFS